MRLPGTFIPVTIAFPTGFLSPWRSVSAGRCLCVTTDLTLGNETNHRTKSGPFSKTVTPVKPSCRASVLVKDAPRPRTPPRKWPAAGTGLPHSLSPREEGPARPAPIVFPAANHRGRRWEERQVLSRCREPVTLWRGRGPVGPRAAGPPPADAVGTPGLRGPGWAGCGQQLTWQRSHSSVF